MLPILSNGHMTSYNPAMASDLTETMAKKLVGRSGPVPDACSNVL